MEKPLLAVLLLGMMLGIGWVDHFIGSERHMDYPTGIKSEEPDVARSQDISPLARTDIFSPGRKPNDEELPRKPNDEKGQLPCGGARQARWNAYHA